MRKEGFRRKRFKMPIWIVIIIVFIISIIYANFSLTNLMIAKNTFYSESEYSNFPIIYQMIGDKKVNIMRAYRDENYTMVSNETLSVLDETRALNLVIEKNGSSFQSLEYEVREKNSRVLIEKTILSVPIGNISNHTLRVQNLIKAGNTYTLSIKIDLIDKRAFYFTNIIYKPRKNLEEALDSVKDFTQSSFDKTKMANFVKYLETSPNRDVKQLFNINLQSSFDQLTWADTKMKLESDLLYKIYQSQDYCFNIDVLYLASCKLNGRIQKFLSTDQYVMRWDDKRFYYMKFNRITDELVLLDTKPYNEQLHRLYLGVTDLSNIEKKESENKQFFVLKKGKAVFLYDNIEKKIINVFSNRINDKNSFIRTSQEYDIKLMSINNNGDVQFLLYGYNSRGNNEGYLGLSYMTYSREEEKVSENFFVPIFTTYQNLKYDLNKLCAVINNQLFFKTYDRVYSINIYTKELNIKTENIDETRSSASSDGVYLAYNKYGETTNTINIINFEKGTEEHIFAQNNELIEVITCMNDDLFYGVTSQNNLWKDGERIIARPFDKIEVINMRTKEEKTFEEDNIYYYNIVTNNQTLKFNKYIKTENSFKLTSNGVIINNAEEEKNEAFEVKEEWTEEKLRIAYITLDISKEKLDFVLNTTSNLKLEEVTPLEKELRIEPDIYYVYNNGTLVSKRNVLPDAISEIRDSYGYVKLNDNATCYNRSNKANVSYLKQNDSILTNLEGFEENFYLKDNSILVMNVTGITERDLEYYITMGEKLAVFYNNQFQYFVTGYDNNNYVLEYLNKDRILTPRAKVHDMIVNQNYIVYAQLEKLE